MQTTNELSDTYSFRISFLDLDIVSLQQIIRKNLIYIRFVSICSSKN